MTCKPEQKDSRIELPLCLSVRRCDSLLIVILLANDTHIIMSRCSCAADAGGVSQVTHLKAAAQKVRHLETFRVSAVPCIWMGTGLPVSVAGYLSTFLQARGGMLCASLSKFSGQPNQHF